MLRYPGGIIRSTPVAPTFLAAPGMWTLPEALQAKAQNIWPSANGNDVFAKLLLHFDGADASTTFTDSCGTPHTVTATANAQIDTAQFKFGTASALFDGTGDFLSSAASADWEFGTGDFTQEFWLRFAATTTCGLISSYRGTAPRGFAFRYVSGSGLRFVFPDDTFVDRAWSPSTATWYHVAVIRTGSTMRMFIDGSQIGADITNSQDINTATTATLQIGRTHTLTDDLNGWLDEMRISKGIARWTGTFTPPSAAYS